VKSGLLLGLIWEPLNSQIRLFYSAFGARSARSAPSKPQASGTAFDEVTGVDLPLNSGSRMAAPTTEYLWEADREWMTDPTAVARLYGRLPA